MEGVLLGMFSKLLVLVLLVIFYVRLQHVEEKRDKVEIILRKKIFPDVNRMIKNKEETGGHQTQYFGW